MDISVESWWLFLSIVSSLNIGLWIFSLIIFKRNRDTIAEKIYPWRKIMLCCSGIYVLVCAFRSFLPRIDLERICLVDSALSTMFIGRSAATIGELSFIILCAILLREAGKGAGDRLAIYVSSALVPVIVVAEGFSWYAMLTTNYFGSVIEESLWTICGILLVISFLWLWPHVKNRHKHFLNAMILFTVGFVIFMITVDVPMYYTRWSDDLAAEKQYLTLLEGIKDSIRACTVNFSQDVWREEIPWMTLYFTTAVWVSISLPLAPNYKQVIKKSSRKRAKQNEKQSSAA